MKKITYKKFAVYNSVNCIKIIRLLCRLIL